MMSPNLKARFKSVVIELEDNRAKAYQDIYGNITVGIGHNLSAHPVSADIIDRWFNEDVDYFYDKLDSTFNWFNDKSDGVKMGLTYMAFNMGWEKFLTFKKFLQALEDDDMPVAIREFQDSKYYRELPRPAKAVFNALRLGTFEVI